MVRARRACQRRIPRPGGQSRPLAENNAATLAGRDVSARHLERAAWAAGGYQGSGRFPGSDASSWTTGALSPTDGGNLAMNAGGSHTSPRRGPVHTALLGPIVRSQDRFHIRPRDEAPDGSRPRLERSLLISRTSHIVVQVLSYPGTFYEPDEHIDADDVVVDELGVATGPVLAPVRPRSAVVTQPSKPVLLLGSAPYI